MGTQAGSARGVARRRRAWSLAVLLSAGLHLVVLGGFAVMRAAAEWRADNPIVSVQLVRLPPPKRDLSQAPPRAAAGRRAHTATDAAVAPRLITTEGAATGPPAFPGIPIDPHWRVDRKGPNPPPRREPDVNQFQPCDPLKDPKRESKACRKVDDIAEAVTRSYDPQAAGRSWSGKRGVTRP